jgi:hypothetical protein
MQQRKHWENDKVLGVERHFVTLKRRPLLRL